MTAATPIVHVAASIHIDRVWLVTCHQCGDVDWTTTSDAHAVRAEFTSYGWEGNSCPTCATTPTSPEAGAP